jgi:hypothetical protein
MTLVNRRLARFDIVAMYHPVRSSLIVVRTIQCTNSVRTVRPMYTDRFVSSEQLVACVSSVDE